MEENLYLVRVGDRRLMLLEVKTDNEDGTYSYKYYEVGYTYTKSKFEIKDVKPIQNPFLYLFNNSNVRVKKVNLNVKGMTMQKIHEYNEKQEKFNKKINILKNQINKLNENVKYKNETDAYSPTKKEYYKNNNDNLGETQTILYTYLNILKKEDNNDKRKSK